jgi:hypothetical protein
MISFIGFVVNLLNRRSDGASVQRPKKSYCSSGFENVKLPFSLRGLKILFCLRFTLSFSAADL